MRRSGFNYAEGDSGFIISDQNAGQSSPITSPGIFAPVPMGPTPLVVDGRSGGDVPVDRSAPGMTTADAGMVSIAAPSTNTLSPAALSQAVQDYAASIPPPQQAPGLPVINAGEERLADPAITDQTAPGTTAPAGGGSVSMSGSAKRKNMWLYPLVIVAAGALVFAGYKYFKK